MLNIIKKKLCEGLFLLEFDNQYELTSTLLRFQEYYESPEFRGKIFSLEEYKNWYIKVKGKFSYYTDWNGFNMPSYILKPFYEGKFNPLSQEENQIIELFNKEKDPFYVISIHKGDNKSLDVLKHEIAHAFFYILPDYRKKILGVLRKFNLEDIKTELKSFGGYHDSVLDDEIQAFSVSDCEKLKTKFPDEMKNRIRDIFSRYLKINKIDI